MLTQTKAQIYLGSQRGSLQTEGFQSCLTFNFEAYQVESRKPFGALSAFNDETLSPECNCKIVVEEDFEIVLIPLVGAIEFDDGIAEELKYINSGEALRFLAQPGMHYILTNPYPDQTINYLQIRFKSDEPETEKSILTQFDLSRSNSLLPIFRTPFACGFIGQFGGREEGFYTNSDSANGIFVLIIEGAFEVQNRLLERRDGLSLRNVDELEFEALSDHAIILVLEVSS